MSFLSVEYHDIGAEDLDPYDEFSVLFPAVVRSTTTLPYLSALTRATRGYVWYLPVTTESAKAVGVDIWGLPKVMADITHEDSGSQRRTTVTVDDDRFITFEVDRPPSMSNQDKNVMYARKDGELVRIPSKVDGELGGWPLSNRVDVTLGDHPRTEPLRELDIGCRALARISIEGEALLYPSEPLSAD